MQEDREKVKTLQNEIKDVKEKLSKAGPSTEEVRTFLLVQFLRYPCNCFNVVTA